MTCARGVSALEEMLQRRGDAQVSALIVWERVSAATMAPEATRPPPTSVLARIRDARAAQFWDPGHVVADALRGSVDTSTLPVDEGVIWDAVLIFAPDARWDETPPKAIWAGGDIVDAVRDLPRF